MDVKKVLVAILLIELAIGFALGVGENESSQQVYIVVKIDFISCQNFNFYCKGIYSKSTNQFWCAVIHAMNSIQYISVG